MKLTIERSALLGALGHAQNVVERRNTIPILSNLQLVAETNSLNLTATDLDLAMGILLDLGWNFDLQLTFGRWHFHWGAGQVAAATGHCQR